MGTTTDTKGKEGWCGIMSNSDLILIPQWLKDLSNDKVKKSSSMSRGLEVEMSVNDFNMVKSVSDGQYYKIGTEKKSDTYVLRIDAGGWWIPVRPIEEKNTRDKNINNDISSAIKNLIVSDKLKKKPFIKVIRGQFPEVSSGVVCRILNKLISSRVIEIDRTFKTKPLLVKGKYWRGNI